MVNSDVMKAIKKIKISTYIVLGLLLMYFAFTCLIVFKNTISGNIRFSNPKEFEEAWKSYFFRNGMWSHSDSIWTYYLTGQLQSEEVVLGSNGWLFFKAVNDSDTIADFEGTNSYTAKDYAKCKAGLEKLDKYCAQKGTRYAVIFAPNKENVYPEFMPRKYRHVLISRTDKLASEMQKAGFHVVNPKETMMNSKDVLMQEYYSYDTHWNQIGAYMGVRMCLDSMDISTVPLENLETDKLDLKVFGYHTGAMDDLAQMVGMREINFNDDNEYIIKDFPTIDWECYETESNLGNVVSFRNDKAKMNARVLLVGDSFRSAMIPSLLFYFSDVYVIHQAAFDTQDIEEIEPDYLVIEYVERYSERVFDLDDILAQTVD